MTVICSHFLNKLLKHLKDDIKYQGIESRQTYIDTSLVHKHLLLGFALVSLAIEDQAHILKKHI